MSVKERITEIEASCAVLKSIAEHYPENSQEYKSIELAANSMLFLVTNMQIKQLDQYLQDITRDEPIGEYGNPT